MVTFRKAAKINLQCTNKKLKNYLKVSIIRLLLRPSPVKLCIGDDNKPTWPHKQIKRSNFFFIIFPYGALKAKLIILKFKVSSLFFWFW